MHTRAATAPSRQRSLTCTVAGRRARGRVGRSATARRPAHVGVRTAPDALCDVPSACGDRDGEASGPAVTAPRRRPFDAGRARGPQRHGGDRLGTGGTVLAHGRHGAGRTADLQRDPPGVWARRGEADRGRRHHRRRLRRGRRIADERDCDDQDNGATRHGRGSLLCRATIRATPVCTSFTLRVVFPSVEFAVFFPVVLAASWALMPHPRAWKPFALAASYVFYAAADPKFCLLLAGVTLANQAGAVLVDTHATPSAPGTRSSPPRSPSTYSCSAFFKYYGFFVEEVDDAARPRRAGRAAAAAHDRAAGRPVASSPSRRSPTWSTSAAGSASRAKTIDVAIYLSFFPHLVAGPIVRAREFLPQLATPRDPRDVPVGAARAAHRASA